MNTETTEKKSIVAMARDFAFEAHRSTNHTYDGKPYEYHLQMVVDVAQVYINLIHVLYAEDVIAACYCHDTVEDTRKSFNDVKKATNERVAEIVYALTNEKGKNRKERANDKYYEGIRKTEFASFVKCCDRIANVQHSKQTGSSMFEKYKKENKEFVEKIYNPQFKPLFDFLESLF